MWLFIILVIGCFAAVLIYGSYFPAEGRASGIVEKVDVEYDSMHGRKGHHTDPRSYHIYVRYKWEGREHLAKSFRAYSTAKYFPGDKVVILVHKTDKTIVNIIE